MVLAMVDTVVEAVRTRINKFAGNRHSLYLRSDLVEDSTFPFSLEEELVVRIQDERLVIERATKLEARRAAAREAVKGEGSS